MPTSVNGEFNVPVALWPLGTTGLLVDIRRIQNAGMSGEFRGIAQLVCSETSLLGYNKAHSPALSTFSFIVLHYNRFSSVQDIYALGKAHMRPNQSAGRVLP